jgi:hypothetical protein
MSAGSADTPTIRFYDAKATPSREVVPQQHGDRRVAVHIAIMEWTPERMVAYTRYDPGLILPRHRHASDSLVYILDGEVTIDGRRCPPGTQIVLPKDAPIGPLVAGPEGCTFLESYAGEVTATDLDVADYEKMLGERGITRLNSDHLEPPGKE